MKRLLSIFYKATLVINIIIFAFFISSCNRQSSSSSIGVNDFDGYHVSFSLVQKAAVKYFDIQKEVFTDWQQCEVLVEQPVICHDLNGKTTAYIFDIVDGDSIKGMLGISAMKKWRPLVFSGTTSLKKHVESLIKSQNLKENDQIEYICINGVNLIFKVTNNFSEDYFLNEPLFHKIDKKQIIKLQNKLLSEKYVKESIQIWDNMEKNTL